MADQDSTRSVPTKLGRPVLATTKQYRTVHVDRNTRTRLHRFRAERALGHPLPPKAVVHHADGSKADTAQLVICQDQAYHMLLHARMRVAKAGGDPNADAICGKCHTAKRRSEFHRSRSGAFGVCTICMTCSTAVMVARFKDIRKANDPERLEGSRRAYRKRAEERNASGLCIRCGGPRDSDRKRCERCLQIERTRDMKRREKP